MTRLAWMTLLLCACQPPANGEVEALLQRAEAAEDRCAYHEAEPDYLQAAELLRQSQPGSPLHRRTLRTLGHLYLTLAEHGRAGEIFGEALALGGEDSEKVQLGCGLASLRLAQDRIAEAREILAGLAPLDDDDRACMLSVQGAIDRGVGRFAEARAAVEELVRLRRSGGEVPAARALNQLGLALEMAGEDQRAESTFESALNLLGGDLPATCGVEELHLALVHNLALTYADLGHDGDAVPLYQLVLDNDQARLGADHPSTANTLHNLALSYEQLDRPAEAIALFQRALGVLERSLGARSSTLIPTLNGLAWTMRDQGDLAQAEALLLRAVDIWEAEPGEKSVWGVSAHDLLGRLYAEEDRDAEAAQHLRRALAYSHVPSQTESIRQFLSVLEAR